MPTTALHGPIYRQLISTAERFEFCERWAFLGEAIDAYRVPADPAIQLAHLRSEFGDQALLDSGFACRDADGQLIPAAGLAANAPLLVLREKPDGQPFDILTSAGSLSGALPLLACLDDHKVQRAIASTLDDRGTDFLLSNDLIDVVILQALGFPVTLAHGIDRIAPAELQVICRRFDWDQNLTKSADIFQSPAAAAASAANVPDDDGIFAGPGSLRDDDSLRDDPADPASSQSPGGNPCDMPAAASSMTDNGDADAQLAAIVARRSSLLFVDFSIAEMRADNSYVGPIRTSLGQLRDSLGLHIGETGVWVPAPRTLESIRFVAGYGDAAVLRARLDESADADGRLLIGDRPTPRAEDEPASTLLDYVNARAQYIAAAKLRSGNTAAARAKLQSAIKAQFIDPLLDRALGCADPLERTYQVAMAHQVERWHWELVELEVGGGPRCDADRIKHVNGLLAQGEKIRKLYGSSPRARTPWSSI